MDQNEVCISVCLSVCTNMMLLAVMFAECILSNISNTYHLHYNYSNIDTVHLLASLPQSRGSYIVLHASIHYTLLSNYYIG